MQNFDEKSANMHMGRLIQMLSHQMKRKNCIVTMIDGDSLTVMQKHILKFILLETLHREIYQKDIEEEFQIRKSTVTGILQLMEKNGFIYRESVEKDARLKRIVPTKKAEALRPTVPHQRIRSPDDPGHFQERCGSLQAGAPANVTKPF